MNTGVAGSNRGTEAKNRLLVKWYKFKATSVGKRLKIEVELLVEYTEVKI